MFGTGKKKYQQSQQPMKPKGYNKTGLERYTHWCNSGANVVEEANHFMIGFQT